MELKQWFEYSFNSTLVQLKGRGQPRHKKSDKSFNSTLVQLKDLTNKKVTRV